MASVVCVTANMLEDEEHLVLSPLPRVSHICEMHIVEQARPFGWSCCVLHLDPLATDPATWSASLVGPGGAELAIGEAVCDPVTAQWQLTVGPCTSVCVARPIPAWACATYAARRNTQEWLAQLQPGVVSEPVDASDTADGYRVMWRALRSKDAARHEVASCMLCSKRRRAGKVALRSHRLCLQCTVCGAKEQTTKAMKLHVASGCSVFPEG